MVLFKVLLVVAVWSLLPGHVVAASQIEPKESEPSAPAASPADTQVKLKYDIEISGEADDDLRSQLAASLPLYVDKKDLPASRAALRGRLDTSLTVGRDVLRSQGYYAGQISGRLLPPLTSGGKIRVALDIDTGERYRFGPMQLSLSGHSDAGLEDLMRQTASQVYVEGAPAQAETGLRIAPALAIRAKELGYPFAKVKDQTFQVDHATRLVRPKIAMNTGRQARIVDTEITGLDTVDPSYVRRLGDFGREEVYDQRNVDAFRERLISTGLFSAISISPVPTAPQQPDAPGQPDLQDVALAVKLSEAPMRQISLQAGFATNEGFSLEGTWSHRNFFGKGEIFTVRGRLAQLEQSIETELALPNFGRIDQTLTFGVGIAREDTDAFNTLRATTSAILERQVSQNWAISGGGRLEAQRVEDDLGRRTFYLGALPLLARYDGTEDIFDPQDGLRLNVQVTPEAGFGDATLLFVTNDVLVRGYKSIDWGYGTVLAARIRAGSIVGEDAPTLPANRRFFAGGGGSIRGYGFQEVGPRDGDGDPFGGRSLLEFAFEARVRVTKTIGIVPFIDGGNVYASTLPKFSGLQYGAGLGVRYHTDFAPIRLDIGTPINPRAGDDRVQVYISVGQSF